MAMNLTCPGREPTRTEIEALAQPTLVEFGASWCGYCRAAQPLLAEIMAEYPQLRHIRIEDGKGRPLGRAFGVKLWPTLVLMDQGKEAARWVRPVSAQAIREVLARVDGAR